MEALGARLAALLRAGDLVLLTGPLGAGKTTLTRGIGAGLGVRGPVQSPTFVLARTHPTSSADRRSCTSTPTGSAAPAELDDLDLDFDRSVVVVEWGAGMLDGVGDSWLEVDIERRPARCAGRRRRRMPRTPSSSAPTSRACSTVRGYGPRWARSPLRGRASRLDPMLLAIDTSTGTAVAVVDRDGGVLAETGTDDTMRHAEVVGGFIRDALAAAGRPPARPLGRRRRHGPGPFTGLRVGIAAAHAFALGIGRPVRARSSSHDAVAWAWYRAGGTGRLQVVTDARRREFAVSDYDGLDDDGLPIRVGGPALRAARRGARRRRGTRLDAQLVPAAAVGMLAELAFAAGPAAARRRRAALPPRARRDAGGRQAGAAMSVLHAPRQASTTSTRSCDSSARRS